MKTVDEAEDVRRAIDFLLRIEVLHHEFQLDVADPVCQSREDRESLGFGGKHRHVVSGEAIDQRNIVRSLFDDDLFAQQQTDYGRVLGHIFFRLF